MLPTTVFLISGPEAVFLILLFIVEKIKIMFGRLLVLQTRVVGHYCAVQILGAPPKLPIVDACS